MPSHALPPGPNRARRRAEWRNRARRRAEWRSTAPTGLVMLTGFQVVDLPWTGGSISHQILDVLGRASGMALFTVPFILALTPLYLRAETLRETQARPRPRWQYLAIAAGWAGLAVGLAFTSWHIGPDWLARSSAATASWFAAFALAMLGRAACWGRVRHIFWWYRPRWITDDTATWLTPPPARARQGSVTPAAGTNTPGPGEV